MEKNQIFIKTGTKYKKMTRELLEESNLAELIGDKNKMVGIKPNLVSPSDPANGGTTHRRKTKAIQKTAAVWN